MRIARGLAVAAVLVCGVSVFAQGQADIVNTSHNLSLVITVDQNQICLPCHVPHNAYPDYAAPTETIDEVLWNHEETNVSFTMYTTLSGHTGVGPEGPSKMCLSCHDGVTAVDNYGGTVSATPYLITGDKALSADLTDDHPIGIVYPSGDPGYNAPPFAGAQLVTVNGVADRVECTSCHEPHNNSLGSFLRSSLAASGLCLECHNK